MNPKYSFSSLNPPYIVKVTKFVFEIFHFQFLVMREKNIFGYKLFLSLNILDFSVFFLYKLQSHPLKKIIHLSYTNPL